MRGSERVRPRRCLSIGLRLWSKARSSRTRCRAPSEGRMQFMRGTVSRRLRQDGTSTSGPIRKGDGCAAISTSRPSEDFRRRLHVALASYTRTRGSSEPSRELAIDDFWKLQRSREYSARTRDLRADDSAASSITTTSAQYGFEFETSRAPLRTVTLSRPVDLRDR